MREEFKNQPVKERRLQMSKFTQSVDRILTEEDRRNIRKRQRECGFRHASQLGTPYITKRNQSIAWCSSCGAVQAIESLTNIVNLSKES